MALSFGAIKAKLVAGNFRMLETIRVEKGTSPSGGRDEIGEKPSTSIYSL
jgi:hypothetical protein